jgi:hypothetical protein
MPATPVLTATPTVPPTYNVGMAETFSWVPIEGAGRPLYARATYLANASDISLSLSAGNISIDTSALENISEETNTLLGGLTSIQVDKQNQIITLLHAITGSAIEVDLNTDQLEVSVDGVETLLNDLTASNKAVPGFSIPPYDQISFEYVGSTDIFRKVTYLNNSTQVMALSFVYVTEPPTTGNAIIQTVKKM